MRLEKKNWVLILKGVVLGAVFGNVIARHFFGYSKTNISYLAEMTAQNILLILVFVILGAVVGYFLSL